jgi:hypothetical protein
MNDTDRAIIDAIRSDVRIKIGMTPAGTLGCPTDIFVIEATCKTADPPMSVVGDFNPDSGLSLAYLIRELAERARGGLPSGKISPHPPDA